ncbi:MAG: alpha/beta hydrolase [Pyrinomonadaceae bacterium]
MASKKRLFKSFSRLLLPLIFLLLPAIAASAIWLVYNAATAPKYAYLVTPEKYGLLSTRGAQVTDETWSNRDGTQARGWLLRGRENAPAVILLHRYGTDRSWMLDFGVKINEATDFTVLMPDLRGHGEDPLVKRTSFGGCEADDVTAAMDFLRGLKSGANNPLVGKDFGVYGVELGALAAVSAASKNENIKALALDSVPRSSNEMLVSVVGGRYPLASALTTKIAVGGTFLYYIAGGCYNHEPLCNTAKSIGNRHILLLAGTDAPDFQDSTGELRNCFPDSNQIESKFDLTTSGYGFKNAPLAQSEAYERQVIDFFKKSLSGGE